MNNYIIYLHTNKINNKKYVGITCREPQIRWGKNGKGYSQQPKFYNAIIKYGWDNFNHSIILKDLSKEEAEELESYYITLYDSINNGYNILQHLISSYKRTKSVYCITSKKKYDSIKSAAIENQCSPTEIIENCKGKRGPIKNKQWTYWDDEQNKPKDIIPFVPKKQPLSKSIYCIELKTIYSSIREACRQLKVERRDLLRVLSEERNGIKGLHFIYAEEKDKIPFIIKQKNGKKTRIYCQETNSIFNSVQEAADFCGKSSQSVIKNCQKKVKRCGNYHFEYLSDLPDDLILKLYKGDSEESDE